MFQILSNGLATQTDELATLKVAAEPVISSLRDPDRKKVYQSRTENILNSDWPEFETKVKVAKDGMRELVEQWQEISDREEGLRSMLNELDERLDKVEPADMPELSLDVLQEHIAICSQVLEYACPQYPPADVHPLSATVDKREARRCESRPQ